jgi:hypothetical protein
MSQIRTVVDCIKQLGQGTVNHVHQLCPQMNRAQVLQALSSAAWQKYLRKVGTESPRAFGVGAPFAIYEATGKHMVDHRIAPPTEKVDPVASVWDMGTRAIEGRPFWNKRVPRQDFATEELE